MSIKLNIYLLYWYFQQNQCLNIKKHVVHNIHGLAWGPWATAMRVIPSILHTAMVVLHIKHSLKCNKENIPVLLRYQVQNQSQV